MWSKHEPLLVFSLFLVVFEIRALDNASSFSLSLSLKCRALAWKESRTRAIFASVSESTITADLEILKKQKKKGKKERRMEMCSLMDLYRLPQSHLWIIYWIYFGYFYFQNGLKWLVSSNTHFKYFSTIEYYFSYNKLSF